MWRKIWGHKLLFQVRITLNKSSYLFLGYILETDALSEFTLLKSQKLCREFLN